jgi:type VI secretion system secreted protein Hcp
MTKSIPKAVLTAITAAAGLFASGSSIAAVDMFLKVSNIQGESVDITHRGEIDVLAWSWGSSTGTAKTNKGTLPLACIQDLSLTKYIDAASPSLVMNSVTGMVAAAAVLTVRKPGAVPLEFLVLRMNNVSVTSYSTGGSGGEDRLTENISLRFASMTGEYTRAGVPPVVFIVGGGTSCP